MPLDQPDHFHDLEMPLGDHLDELRRRLIFMGVGVVIAALVTFTFGFQLIAWLAQPMLQAQDAMGFAPQTVQLDPTAGFTTVYLPVSLIAAMILASPWIIFQLWQFVVVGLYAREKRAVHILAPFSTMMTALGIAFTYYVLLPVCLMFFLSFANHYPKVELNRPNWVMQKLLLAYGVDSSAPPTLETSAREPAMFPVLEVDPAAPAEGAVWINSREGKLKAVVSGQTRVIGLRSQKLLAATPQLSQYIRFATLMMLGVVVAFQLPVVMLVAGWTGLIDPDAIARLRKYAVFAAFLGGAILGPTDIFSMFVLAVPLYLLFELGLLLMRWVTPEPEGEPPAEL